MVSRQYFMEWGMVWRDVAFGFTFAGVIAAFVPSSFFTTLFVGAGSGVEASFGEVLLQTVVGPLAAFLTFIGSMGNIPLASILYANDVSFAGVMAFIFSDLVVFPVLRISAQYFGWKMAFYILAVFLAALIVSAITLHYGFAAFDLLPEGSVAAERIDPSERFQVDYTLFLNVAFICATGFLFWMSRQPKDDQSGKHSHHHAAEPSWSDRLLTGVACLSFVWLAGGFVISLVT